MNIKPVSIIKKEELDIIRLSKSIAPKHDFYKLIKIYDFSINFKDYVDLRVDDITFYAGIYQFVDFRLCNKENFTWAENGIPLNIVNNLTRGNNEATQIGDIMRFDKMHYIVTIKDYSKKKFVNSSKNEIMPEQVGADFGQYGVVWFNYLPLMLRSAIEKRRVLWYEKRKQNKNFKRILFNIY